MKRRIFTRSTGTPTLRAAIAEPPEPKIQLPKLVRWRMNVATSARPSHQTMATLNGPMSVGEDRRQRVAIGRRAEAADLGPPGDRAGHADRHAAQDEERAERDDERGQLGADDDVAVDESDEEREGEGRHDGQPDRPAELADADRHDHAGRADHRADREVELAGDHQEGHGRADDADLRRDLEIGGGAVEGEEAAVAGQDGEDDPDEDRSGHGAQAPAG